MKDYSTVAGVFPIALVIRDDPHTKLPIAYLLKIPDRCRGRLIPHISNECILCYVEQMEADWDPNDLANTYRDVDAQIQLTLNNALASAGGGDPSDAELEGEFSAYWKPEENLYLLAKPDKRTNLSTWLSESKWPDGSLRREYVTVSPSQDHDHHELSKWLNQRRLTTESLKGAPISTHYVAIKPAKLAGVIWPPSSFRDVLTWLAEVDQNARCKVIDYLLSTKKKRHILLFDVAKQDILAIYIEIEIKATGLERHYKSGRRTASVQHLTSVLGGKQANSGFKRLNVIKADRDSLLSRNLARPGIGNLSDKRIALIGCGTIGGYVAGLLLRSGAGCGGQHYHLYDDDKFSPHNFGRHALTAHDFGRYKATALADNLMNSVHIARNIEGFASQFPISPDTLAEYDIVIDATGRPPVSKRLAFIIRTMKNRLRPTLIHAFNDGNGRASKVLVDDGSCCYGCMVTEPATHSNGVDLRFEGIEQARERYISCGSTYTPYDAAVSHITAALAQEAVLNTLESVIPWNYNEHILNGSRSRKPRSLKRQPNCPICNDR